MKRLALCAVVVLAGVEQMVEGAVIIETVPVGNVGNAGDVQPGGTFGAVGYAYNIGKYEVTAGQYTAFLGDVAATDTYGLYNGNMWSSCRIQQSGLSGSYSYSVAADRADRPVSDVSWGDAARFSNWLHNGQPTGAQDANTTEDGAYFLNGAMSEAALMAVSREADWKWAIPTEDEWYKAAYHKNDGDTGNYYLYPTSSDTVPGDGELELSESPYGTFGQGGNVWEWNEANFGSYRGVRGDSPEAWFVGPQYPPWYEDHRIGFRVASSAAVPEPSTLIVWSLLILSGIGIGWYRRRKA